MTKGELRKARKQARAEGKPLTGELAIPGLVPIEQYKMQQSVKARSKGTVNTPMKGTLSLSQQMRRAESKIMRQRLDANKASREEQHERYIDCGPGAWDDK